MTSIGGHPEYAFNGGGCCGGGRLCGRRQRLNPLDSSRIAPLAIVWRTSETVAQSLHRAVRRGATVCDAVPLEPNPNAMSADQCRADQCLCGPAPVRPSVIAFIGGNRESPPVDPQRKAVTAGKVYSKVRTVTHAPFANVGLHRLHPVSNNCPETTMKSMPTLPTLHVVLGDVVRVAHTIGHG
jgi:hypothetical protein